MQGNVDEAEVYDWMEKVHAHVLRMYPIRKQARHVARRNGHPFHDVRTSAGYF